jgi:hypothetical protein
MFAQAINRLWHRRPGVLRYPQFDTVPPTPARDDDHVLDGGNTKKADQKADDRANRHDSPHRLGSSFNVTIAAKNLAPAHLENLRSRTDPLRGGRIAATRTTTTTNETGRRALP